MAVIGVASDWGSFLIVTGVVVSFLTIDVFEESVVGVESTFLSIGVFIESVVGIDAFLTGIDVVEFRPLVAATFFA